MLDARTSTMTRACAHQKPKGQAMTRYRCILADPPWPYGDMQANRPENYARMALAEIKALDVWELAHRNSALFLWVTGPMMREGLSVMRAWGFSYRTVAFVWSKVSKAGNPKINIGHYTRPSTEFCLLGIRGRVDVVNHGVRQLIESVPERIHSRKPGEARERIVELLGDVPRIELFAREAVAGWSRWGLEAPKGEGLVTMDDFGAWVLPEERVAS